MSTTARCSQFARTDGQSPGGTAGHYAGFLLIEWPDPWPRDAGDVPELAAVAAAASARRIRLQLVRSLGRPGSTGPVTLYERPDGDWFTAYEGRSARADGATPEAIAELAAAMLLGDESGEPLLGTDVLVCTHGARDVCCGGQGTRLAEALGAAHRDADEVRVLRTSHLGGHRFAPTALILPTGTMWAYLDEERAQGVVTNDPDVLSRVAGHYRGCAGLPSPEAQVVETAALSEVGWSLLDRPRRAGSDDDGRWLLDVAPSGEASGERWTGTVDVARTVTVLACLDDDRGRDKSQAELRMTSVRREQLDPTAVDPA